MLDYNIQEIINWGMNINVEKILILEWTGEEKWYVILWLYLICIQLILRVIFTDPDPDSKKGKKKKKKINSEKENELNK